MPIYVLFGSLLDSFMFYLITSVYSISPLYRILQTPIEMKTAIQRVACISSGSSSLVSKVRLKWLEFRHIKDIIDLTWSICTLMKFFFIYQTCLRAAGSEAFLIYQTCLRVGGSEYLHHGLQLSHNLIFIKLSILNTCVVDNCVEDGP